MNAIGIFAGRGDVVLGMAFALLVGAWVGWKLRGIAVWVKAKKESKNAQPFKG